MKVCPKNSLIQGTVIGVRINGLSDLVVDGVLEVRQGLDRREVAQDERTRGREW
jgi:hypothetical protein